MSLMLCITDMNVHELDLNLLRVFDAVLHEKGVTAAAGRLGLTQPAVSNALARLRGAFGDPLFVRTAGGMDATPFARELAAPVRQALALLERAQCDAAGVRLEAVGVDVEDIAGALAAGALDLAVGFLPGLGPPVMRQPLFRDPYACLMRADHPAAAGTLTRKKFLEASHVLVSYRGGHRVIEEALERAGAGRRIALRVPHFTVVPMVLERSDLLLTLPARVARVYEKRGNLVSRPLPIPMPQAEVAVHWHERFEADAGNRWLRGLIGELFAG